MGTANKEEVSRIACDVENHLRVHRGVPIPPEEIRSLIRNCVSYLLEHDDQAYATSSCGDTLVVAHRYEMEKTLMQVYICKMQEGANRIEIGPA